MEMIKINLRKSRQMHMNTGDLIKYRNAEVERDNFMNIRSEKTSMGTKDLNKLILHKL